MARWQPLRAAIWRRGRACFSAGSRSTRAAASAPFHSWTRRRHFRLHPPPLPREPRELRIPGHARPTQGLVDSGGSRWDKQHGLAAREGPSPKGRDIEERLVEQVGEGRGRDIALSGGTDLVKRKKKKIGEQRRDSGLVRRRHGGGDTNAKKGQGQDGQSWKKGSQAAGCNF